MIVNDEVTFESKDVTADNVTDLLKNHLLNNQSMLGGYLIDVESVQHAGRVQYKILHSSFINYTVFFLF